MNTICGERIDDNIFRIPCKERMEAVLQNLCLVSDDDSKAAAEILTAIRMRKGMNQSEIARCENVSRQAISKRIKLSKFLHATQLKIRLNKKIFESNVVPEIVYQMYMDGICYEKISKHIGVYRDRVKSIARKYAYENGLPFEEKRIVHRNIKYFQDETYV